MLLVCSLGGCSVYYVTARMAVQTIYILTCQYYYTSVHFCKGYESTCSLYLFGAKHCLSCLFPGLDCTYSDRQFVVLLVAYAVSKAAHLQLAHGDQTSTLEQGSVCARPPL